MTELRKIKKALVSVSDKSNLEKLALSLKGLNVEIISSGGTGKFLESKGFSFTPIEKVTGNPEAFGGRMKTLSFQVGSSLLFRRNHDKDIEEASRLGIQPIDLVICNLYPFNKMLQQGKDLDELVENIDVGGPTMIRAAAKNFESVCTCISVDQYDFLLDTLKRMKGCTDLITRKRLSMEAFRYTASYDALIASALEKKFSAKNKTLILSAHKANELRYGENPHQQGWVYQDNTSKGLAHSKSLQGKPLSYNNLLDADSALRCTSDLHSLKCEKFSYAATVVKHSNPCGAALCKNPLSALEMSWSGDKMSAFGSILCFNFLVSLEIAQWLSDKFIEVIIAPDFTDEALNAFSNKKNLRLIKTDMLKLDKSEMLVRSISGGWVVQNEDIGEDQEFYSTTNISFQENKKTLLQFGVYVSKHLKSNAIALVKEKEKGVCLMGAGMGNPNRLLSLTQAIEKAKENGCTSFEDVFLISDAFFPFKDAIEMAHKFGFKNIIQPGGSIRDKEIIDCANKFHMSMTFTGRRHFRH